MTIGSGPLSGDGVTAQVLNTANSQLSDDGRLTIDFDNAPATIAAGTPFIIKWDNTGNNIVNPQFNDVTITAVTSSAAEFQGGGFVGDFSTFEITNDNINDIILLTNNNTLGYSKSARTLHAFRAHFVARRTQDAPAVRFFDIHFDDQDDATGISVATSSTPKEGQDDAWYTLSGHRLQGKPAAKGIYINNGHKVVIQ